jgi:hypothetical protein
VIQIGQSVLKPRKVEHNFEIVLDRSAGMSQSFGGKTRLDAAISAVEKALHDRVADRDNLAFRQFGGPCGSDSSKLIVGFGQNNEGSVRKALQGETVGGDSDLVRAIVSASADFNDAERFDGVNKGIIVVTGGDSCKRTQAEIGELLGERLKPLGKDHGISLDFRFVGVGVPPDQQAELSLLAQETGGRAYFPQSQTELDGILTTALVVEPVIKDVNTLTGIVNKVIDGLNSMIQHVDKKEFKEGETDLEQARSDYKRQARAFDDLGKRQSREEFQKAYSLASSLRGVQSKLLDLSDKIIVVGKAGDAAAMQETTKRYNELIGTYNEDMNILNASLNGLGTANSPIGFAS